MQKENGKKISLIIIGILVLIGTFYGGIIYGKKNQIPKRNQNMQTFGQNNIVGNMKNTRNVDLEGFTNGKIISKDANNITVQLMTNGTKIIFLDTNTTVSKMATGAISDLIIGTQVSITGTTNVDGSITAKSVQIRPNTPSVLK